MYQADLQHDNKPLQEKLQALYTLSRGKALDLSFRPPYLDLLNAFGNPHEHLPPVIHVAGTNGKGSIIAMLNAILSEAGYKVHSYTSPHLKKFNERIVLASEQIDDVMLEQLIDEAMHLNAGKEITFFEITTAIAFEAFRRVEADIVLLEVGLGGKLDCTNIIAKPYVSVINRISNDHTEFLGNTISQIAQEKAGIIKYETPCIAGYQDPDLAQNGEKSAVDIIVDTSVDKKAPLYCAERDWTCEPSCNGMRFSMHIPAQDNARNITLDLPAPSLIGTHQIQNAGAAIAALQILQNPFPISPEQIAQGLQKTIWPARMQHITSSILNNDMPNEWELWFDGGHNDSAGIALGQILGQWNKNEPTPVHLILAMKGDKSPKDFLDPLKPYIGSCTIIPLHGVGPCASIDDIKPILSCPLYKEDNMQNAIKNITRQNKKQEKARILICGSLYLAEQI